MKTLDYIIRNWRYRVVAPHVPAGCRILDIGGFDGSFLLHLSDKIESGISIDPLIVSRKMGKIEFIRSESSDSLPFPDSSFDAVALLAVYEHLGDLRESITAEIFRVLKDRGVALLTVPSSMVDHILKILLKLRLIDGMCLEQHSHFESGDTVGIFQRHGFVLKRWARFQLGLNNFFLFEKREHG